MDGVLSLPNPVGSVADKINVGVYRLKSLLGTLDDVYAAPEMTTEAKLQELPPPRTHRATHVLGTAGLNACDVYARTEAVARAAGRGVFGRDD